MPFLRSLNLFVELYRAPLRQFFSFSVWWPLALFAGVSVLALLGLVNYLQPALYAMYHPFLQAMGNMSEALGGGANVTTQFSHYPAHFRLLPGQFEWVKLPVALLFEGVAIAVTARGFARRFARFASDSATAPENTNRFPRLTVVSWLKIAGVWLLMYVLISAVAYSLPHLFDTWLSGSPRRAQLFDLGLFTLTTALIAPFVYAFPLFGIGARSDGTSPGFMDALRMSLTLFGRHPIMSLLLVLAPSFLFTYPLIWAVSPSAGFATKLQPELMVYLLIALIGGNMLVNFLFSGAATRLIYEETR